MSVYIYVLCVRIIQVVLGISVLTEIDHVNKLFIIVMFRVFDNSSEMFNTIIMVVS